MSDIIATRAGDAAEMPDAELWSLAIVAYRGLTETEIDALLERKPHEHTEHSWRLVAVIALDQSGIDPRRVVLR